LIFKNIFSRLAKKLEDSVYVSNHLSMYINIILKQLAGYAGIVNVGGLRIGGISGIYKGCDYHKGIVLLCLITLHVYLHEYSCNCMYSNRKVLMNR